MFGYMKLGDDKWGIKAKLLKKRASSDDGHHPLQDRGKSNLVASEGNDRMT